MSFHWVILISSAFLLVLPLPAFYSRKRRYRNLHQLEIERRNGSRWLIAKHVIRFWGHWIELVRGAAAAYCLLATIDQVSTVSALYAKHADWARFVLPLALAIICVILISVLFRYPGKAIAPVSFVAATLLVLVPLRVSVPAVLFGLFCSLKLRSLPFFFLFTAPIVGLSGVFLDKNLWPSVAGAVLTITPLALAYAQRRELVIPVRRTHSG